MVRNFGQAKLEEATENNHHCVTRAPAARLRGDKLRWESRRKGNQWIPSAAYPTLDARRE